MAKLRQTCYLPVIICECNFERNGCHPEAKDVCTTAQHAPLECRKPRICTVEAPQRHMVRAFAWLMDRIQIPELPALHKGVQRL
jgi:hypothetical protein